MKARLVQWTAGWMVGALLLGAAGAQAQFSLLHEFAGGGSDGSRPEGSLTVSGSMLYGMTYYGGDAGAGTVFKMNTSGAGFSLLHEFAGGSNGRGPQNSLVLSSSTLYGMTTAGGDWNVGLLFSINTDGIGFTPLRSFGGQYGANPYGSLIVSDSILYGTTKDGGPDQYSVGTVFKMNTGGTGYQLLHKFDFRYPETDGREPYCTLMLSGSTLYGTTYNGGDNSRGTVFKVNTDGTGFTLLHEFAGGVNDGRYPRGSLTLSDTTLYGMTSYGGDNDFGTVFKMNTDGTGFQLLHEFAGGVNDGREPYYGDLTLFGSALYGMTYRGGNSDLGTVFQVNTDGTGFTLLHEFAGGVNDGANPCGSLTLSGSTLYGMTRNGGDTNDGTVFKYELPPIPEPSSLALAAAGSLALLARRRRI
jgi:uncharacterized repeat protein (TIGR03803 family)